LICCLAWSSCWGDVAWSSCWGDVAWGSCWVDVAWSSCWGDVTWCSCRGDVAWCSCWGDVAWSSCHVDIALSQLLVGLSMAGELHLARFLAALSPDIVDESVQYSPKTVDPIIVSRLFEVRCCGKTRGALLHLGTCGALLHCDKTGVSLG
jgi:hypothetical protein